MTGKLIVFSAPSGSGKTTLIQWLMQQQLPIGFSVSATSRAPRAHEQDGVDYHFLSPEAFKQKIEANEFLEWEEVYPNKFYGTLTQEVEQKLQNGQHVLLDVDVKGGIHIKETYGKQACAIFVQPPSIDVLRDRLQKRATDSPEVIEERISKAAYELEFANRFDHIIINDDLEAAKKDCYSIVNQFLT